MKLRKILSIVLAMGMTVSMVSVAFAEAARPLPIAIDGTDYSRIKRSTRPLSEVGGAIGATAEQMAEAARNHVIRDSAAGASRLLPIDGTDYSQINRSSATRTTSEVGGAIGATAEQMAEAARNHIIRDSAANASRINTRAAASWITVDRRPFTYYAQEEDYTCGPASVKMLLKYLTGDTYAESTVASGCGTTSASGGTYLLNMQSYLNDEQIFEYYLDYAGNWHKNFFASDLLSIIDLQNVPTIVGLVESTDEGWAYDTPNGHFVVVYGAMSDQSEFAVADPWAGFVNAASNRLVDKSLDDLYHAATTGEADGVGGELGYLY